MAEHVHNTPPIPAPSVKQVTPRRTLFGVVALGFFGSPSRGASIPHRGDNPPNDAGGMVSMPMRSPDAELLALCDEFHRLNHEVYTLPEDGPRTMEQAYDERWALTDLLVELRPRTFDGRIAKAGVALALIEEDTSGGATDSFEDFVLATLRDVVGRAPVSFRGAA